MDEKFPSQQGVKKTDKIVKFCSKCSLGNQCKECDKTFNRKDPLHSTSFHQIRTDITNFVSGRSKDMIVDIGCPNSVISRKDADNFIKNLSKFQQENLASIQVDEKFKFGPSGPFQCVEKLQFPIKSGSKQFITEVAIVEVNIPMLLGNNFLKPLQAEIKLFASGDGILKLKDLEIKMKETIGGHYTVKVKDLGKMCERFGDSSTFCAAPGSDEIASKQMKSILKDSKEGKNTEHENSTENILTELNTLFNGSKSSREEKLITTIIQLTQVQGRKSGIECSESKIGFSSELKKHMDSNHGGSTKQILLSHHDVRGIDDFDDVSNDDQIELDPVIWEMLLADNDERELSEGEEKEILKLHRYFAHRNGRKLWENLLQPSGRFKGKKKLVLEFLENCEVCRKHKKTPPRPKVGLPKAKDVNDVVSIDLKIMKKDGKRKREVAILYLHDEFSKLIKGQVVNDKNKDTIIKGIENKWIIGGGAGPGHPTRGFFSDNGGEFLNEDFIDFAAALNISVQMTAASSPWMNGSCERAHATVDRIVEKILEDDPKIGLQKAVDHACFVKNTEINKTGFSPLQLFCGKSPAFPGLSDCSPSSIDLEGSNEYMKILRRMDQVRISARQIDCDQRMKTALKAKINSSCEKSYNFGDQVHFKLDSSNKWKTGTVLGKHGKVLFVKYGNFIRRVTLDRVIPADGYHDATDVEVDKNDEENEDRLLDDNFENIEIVVEKEREIDLLKKENIAQKKQIIELECAASGKSNSNKATHINPTMALPKLYQKIKFRKAGKEVFIFGKVVYKHKMASIHKNKVVIKLDDGSEQEYDFSKEIDEWEDVNAVYEDFIDPCCLHSFSVDPNIQHDTYATVLTRAQVNVRPDAEKVMREEIEKFQRFDAFKTVSDEGQHAIKTRWVFTESEDQTKGSKLKARLCVRGDTERNTESIRADSPTAHKDSLKLALAIAANEGFDLVSADIKSAFLQGRSLSRKVYVLPPPEARQDGKLWLLQKGAYGLIDGSRLFYLELKDKLEQLGMRTVSGDQALFTKHEDGKLVGILCVHVDDLLMGGNEQFRNSIHKKLLNIFHFSKIEENKFKYLGCEIEKSDDGDIYLNQKDYIMKIEEVNVPAGRNSWKVSESEQKEIRRVVGELLWVSLMTRPDLSFEVNRLSSNISDATIKDLKDAKRLVEKAKFEPVTLRFTNLGPKEKLRIRLYTDASFNNQSDKLRSTEGRILLLENKDIPGKANAFSWKTKKISRICRSVKGAETRALENGLDEAVHFARMVSEIYDGKLDLKRPVQIEVVALTDNKGLWDNLYNTRQCEEKLLRNSVALIKEMMEKSEVKKVDWVETSEMLADILTKKGGPGIWIKEVISRNNF